MSNEKIEWNWSRLLSAFAVDGAGDKKPPVACLFGFKLLESAITTFIDQVDSDEKKKLFKRALERVKAGTLRLSFAQIAAACLPWRDPLVKKPSSTWHDSLPVELLVLVLENHKTVDDVHSAAASDSIGEDAWSALKQLLEEAARLANADNGWTTSKLLADVSLQVSDAAPSRCHSWVAVEWGTTEGSNEKQGMCLLPAVVQDAAGTPQASLFLPPVLKVLLPDRAAADVWVPDPRTLVTLHQPKVIDFANEASRRVALELPKLEVDELTRAAQLLSSYQFLLPTKDGKNEAKSLWNAALELDPSATESQPDADLWRLRQLSFNERLKSLISNAREGFTTADRELLIAAIWARRLRAIAANGLAYSDGSGVKSIGKVKDLGPAQLAPHNPPADDTGATTGLAKPILETQPLLAALYLAVRMGSAASGASARSLNISIGDVGSGVADFLARPQQVYFEVAKTIRKELRRESDTNTDVTAKGVMDWLRSPRASGFRPGRSMVGIDVFNLAAGVAKEKLILETAPGAEVADLKVADSNAVALLKSRATTVALMKALEKVYGNPQPGGLPVFIADLVNAGLKASSGEQITDATARRLQGQDEPKIDTAGLRRLLHGFDNLDRLVCHLAARAETNKEPLTGSRDIVRMGRGRFIKDYVDDSGEFSPAVLSRVYSRAWSKTNARAQFIAATRSSQLPATCKPSNVAVGGPSQAGAACGCEAKPGDGTKPYQNGRDFPDLAHLFGLTDVPACNWGDSIHGPAAYLADVLEFLRHRRLIATGTDDQKSKSKENEDSSKSALDLLLDRRPDLADIDLNDKNATVEMPFIDLVNEVLERQVAKCDAFRIDVELSDWNPEDNQPLQDDFFSVLDESLQIWGIQLQTPVWVSVVRDRYSDQHCKHERWILRDRIGLTLEAARIVKGKTTEPWRVRLLPQTVLSAAELAFEPQFVERRAYKSLATASVPGHHKLPWSLGESQVREWLDLVGVTPLEVLAQTPPGGAQRTGPHGLPYSVSRIGLSLAEGAGLIFAAKMEDKLLGAENHDSLTLSEFLHRAQVPFEDVRALQQTHSVGRVHGFRLIPVEGDECSADSTRVKVRWNDKTGASFTGKFLRLRRALGWTIADLDLALSSPNIGHGKLDERAAGCLDQLLEFRDRLRLGTHEALLVFTRLRTTALWGAPCGEWTSVFLDTRVNCADPFLDKDALEVFKDLSRPGNGQLTLRNRLDQEDEEQRKPLESKVHQILGAVLRVTPANANMLVEARHGTGTDWRHLNREGLAQLYGASLLLRAMGIDAKALRALVSMMKGNPFEDPGLALDLLDLQQEIDATSLSPSTLAACLQPPAENLSTADAEAATPSPLAVMNTVLALHRSLQQMEQQGNQVLLELGDPNATNAPKAWWEGHLGLKEGWEGTWSDRLSLLAGPVRRLLPRIKLAAEGLRRDGVKAFALGRSDFSSTTLLAENLEEIEGHLGQLPPEDPATAVGGGGLLRSDVAKWIVKLFAPLLQWAGLSENEVQTRLLLWLQVSAAGSDRSPPQSGIAVSQPQVTAQLASYLLCQPLERFMFMQDRQAALSAALSQALSIEEGPAWALLSATPAAHSGEQSAATWWLQLDLSSLQKTWLGPAGLSLEGRSQDAELQTAFTHVSAIQRFALVSAAWKLDASAVHWLFERSRKTGDAAPADRMGVLAPRDLLPAADEARADGFLAGVASKWRLLAAWATAFQATPDVEQPAGAGGRVSLRGDVLAPVLSVADSARLDDNSWSRLSVALDRLLGLTSGTVAALLETPGNASLLLKPSTMSWLKVVSDLLARTGLSIAELRQTARALTSRNEDGLRSVSGRLRSGLRKRFTDDGWITTVRKGQDKLREQKRDALVAVLLSQKKQPWAQGSEQLSADRLYEHLLLDTQMSSCMTTSRIVQAHAVVQQFAQRCTMGLEAGWQIPANELIDWNQWKWMQSYRVWETCRKIFLYPENWMEPEVRDDKSRFFEELESDLNQGELTNENAELAFTRYLHKLHDVARLDVVANYYEFDPNEPVMHILARTPSEPYRYYYRQWVDERHWTPWELVDLEIDSQHVVLFKRGGRLYLGWMTAKHEQDRPKPQSTFTTTKIPTKDGENYTVSGVEEPKVCWKLQLTTSQKAKEGWQPKRTSPGQLDWPPKPVAMSTLAGENTIDRLQLTFQDYGIPEILVVALVPKSEENTAKRHVIGSFSLQSCLGVAQAEPVSGTEFFAYPIVENAAPDGARQIELKSRTNQDLVLLEGTANTAASAHPSVLQERDPGVDPTPGRFAVTPATQTSLLDAAIATARAALVPNPSAGGIFTMGLGLPFFYSDDAVDIVVRVNFSSQEPADRARINARHIARRMAALREAVLTEDVQKKIWDFEARSTDEAWAQSVLTAIERTAPLVSAGSLADLLEAVSRYNPNEDGVLPPFEMAARTHHPMACELVNRAESRGVASIFNGNLQQTKRDVVYRGRNRTRLSESAIERFGCYALAYDATYDAYAGYNWEIFYHAPFMIALKFASEAKFEESMRWFHYIFDPIGVDEGASTDDGIVRRQFWKLRPFRTGMEDSYKGHPIEVLLDPRKWGKEVQSAALQDLVDSIMAWRRKPNLPFQVARGRWSAFQKAVVYRYIDMLIAWGDARFRSDTREDITAASQLYVLAEQLLGRRPRTDIVMCDHGQASGTGARNYAQLQQLIDQRDDELSAYLDQLLGQVDDLTDCTENEAPDSPHLNFYNEYFCIPPNEKLFDLWDRVTDRLYKVRNCLNIDGVFRIPSLFAPPIDPALLARAGAAGLSFDQIMAGLNQPGSHYRFSVMLQKANDAAAELRTLGSELLQALEKRDAEELTLLRSRLDLQAIRLNKDIRNEQVKEVKTQLESIEAQIENVKNRQAWYLQRLAQGTSAKELEAIDGIRSGLMIRTRVTQIKSVAAYMSGQPTFTVGWNGGFGSPHYALAIGGDYFAKRQNFFAEMLAIESDKNQTSAGITATLANYERRLEDWQLQRDMATGEIASLEKQRSAAEIRLTIALAEMRNLNRSIESAEATDNFLKSKFTNSGLYDWMVRQVSAVYYKTYQLASDYARAAEDCLNRELPLSQSGVKVIRSDHWNGLRKGLLAATSLIHDLKRLEAEQIKRNQRIPELTKHVSLAVVDPAQLIELRATGSCTFKIPEVLFEMDHLGHFARRIKSVALSVPCVSGPYSNVSCKLSLISSAIRRRPGDKDLEKLMTPAEAVFTSSGTNDSGLWELNLRDERYLPFEGAGAADSEWKIELPSVVRQFDYATISDVVLHIRYTSEPGRNLEDAKRDMITKLNDAKASTGPIWAYTSLRSDLADQFAVLLKARPNRQVNLKLPKEIARWMGQAIVPTGKAKIFLLGDSTAPVLVKLAMNEYKCEAFDTTKTSWVANFDLRPQQFLDESGFTLEINGIDQLRDVIICFAATLGESPRLS